PNIGVAFAAIGQGGTNSLPPETRLDGEGVKLPRRPCRPFASSGDRESYRGTPIEGDDGEAAGVELEVPKGFERASTARVGALVLSANGIPGGVEGAPA